MKAAVYYENGGPEVLKYEDAPDPQVHPKGVIIRVEAIAIEGGDTLNRWRGPLMTKPHVVGYQAAGEIIAVGDEVTTCASARRSPPSTTGAATRPCAPFPPATAGPYRTAMTSRRPPPSR